MEPKLAPIKAKSFFAEHTLHLNAKLEEFCSKEMPKEILSQDIRLNTDRNNQPIILVVVWYR